MTESLGEHNVRERLTAFADGELTATEILEVLDYLSEHCEALEWMKDEYRLRVEVDRAVRAQTPAVPIELRQRIEKLAADLVPARMLIERGSGVSRWRVLSPALAALIAGVLLGVFVLARPRVREFHQPDLVPVLFTASMTRTHVDCSRFAERIHSSEIPKELSNVSAAIKADLQRDQAFPDLSSLGYRYVGAGPCAKPVENTVHLLYAADREDLRDTLSVFVQAYSGQFSLERGKVYTLSTSVSPHPMLGWRTDRAVYFLIGDEGVVTRKASDLILHR